MKQTMLLVDEVELELLADGLTELLDRKPGEGRKGTREGAVVLWLKVAQAHRRLVPWWSLLDQAPAVVEAEIIRKLLPPPAPVKKKAAKSPTPAAAAGKRLAPVTPEDAAAARRRENARKGGIARALKAGQTVTAKAG